MPFRNPPELRTSITGLVVNHSQTQLVEAAPGQELLCNDPDEPGMVTILVVHATDAEGVEHYLELVYPADSTIDDHNEEDPRSTPGYLPQLARMDLGADAAQADIDYHVAFLTGLSPDEFATYLSDMMYGPP